jgi:hypothetical protein
MAVKEDGENMLDLTYVKKEILDEKCCYHCSNSKELYQNDKFKFILYCGKDTGGWLGPRPPEENKVAYEGYCKFFHTFEINLEELGKLLEKELNKC